MYCVRVLTNTNTCILYNNNYIHNIILLFCFSAIGAQPIISDALFLCGEVWVVYETKNAGSEPRGTDPPTKKGKQSHKAFRCEDQPEVNESEAHFGVRRRRIAWRLRDDRRVRGANADRVHPRKAAHRLQHEGAVEEEDERHDVLERDDTQVVEDVCDHLLQVDGVDASRLLAQLFHLLAGHVEVRLQVDPDETEAEGAEHDDREHARRLERPMRHDARRHITLLSHQVAPHDRPHPQHGDEQRGDDVDVEEESDEGAVARVAQRPEVHAREPQAGEAEQGAERARHAGEHHAARQQRRRPAGLDALRAQERVRRVREPLVRRLEPELERVVVDDEHCHRGDEEEEAEEDAHHPLAAVVRVEVHRREREQHLQREPDHQQAPQHAEVELRLRLHRPVVDLGERVHERRADGEVDQPLVVGVEVHREDVDRLDASRLQLDREALRHAQLVVLLAVVAFSTPAWHAVLASQTAQFGFGRM